MNQIELMDGWANCSIAGNAAWIELVSSWKGDLCNLAKWSFAIQELLGNIAKWSDSRAFSKSFSISTSPFFGNFQAD